MITTVLLITGSLLNVEYNWIWDKYSLFTDGPCSTFCNDTVKIGIWRKISQNILDPGPILTYFTGLVGVLVGMIIQIFVWRSPKERCYGNQLNMADVRKRRVEWLLLFASASDYGLADRKYALKRFNGNNQATSCSNLVNLCPIISEFMLLKRTIFAAIRPQFDDNLHSSRCRFETDWKIAILISAQ